MRCTFKIVEKDGKNIAWCDGCKHGYETEMLDPAKHVRECKPGRGKKSKRFRGLGDVVAYGLSVVGIKPCGGCKERQETLNRLVPF